MNTKRTPKNNRGKIYLWWNLPNLQVIPETPGITFYQIPHKYVQHFTQHKHNITSWKKSPKHFHFKTKQGPKHWHKLPIHITFITHCLSTGESASTINKTKRSSHFLLI